MSATPCLVVAALLLAGELHAAERCPEITPSTNEERAAALFRLCALADDVAAPPQPATWMDPDAAACAVVTDSQASAESRRRYAIAKLAARLEVAGVGPSAQVRPESVVGPLRLLLKPPEDLDELVVAMKGAELRKAREENVLLFLEAKLGPAIRGCGVSIHATTIAQPRENVWRAVFHSSVHGRTMEELRRAIDPQNWRTCNPLFWEEAHLIERPCMPGQVCGDAPQCDVRPGLRRPSAGTSYRGQLFEHFRIGLSGKSWCGLKTVLQIDWLEGRDRFNYDLIESRGRETLGGSALCGVSVDEGFAELTQKGEAIEFQGEKTIQFRANPPDDFDRWLNASAPASLCVMGALVAGGLCCDAP